MILFDSLMRLLFPAKCVLCGRVLEHDELDLCRQCRVEAPEHPLPSTSRPFLKSWRALWYYEGNVRRSILRYKFYGSRSYASAYGRLLAMKIQEDSSADFDLLTWVPVSRRRKRRRGYDQVELLTAEVGKELGVNPVCLIKKIRHNRPQSGINGPAHRRANVLGAYEPMHPEQIAGKRILLLDDVITTGATAGECARVLLTAGAAEVHFAALAAAHHQNRTSR